MENVSIYYNNTIRVISSFSLKHISEKKSCSDGHPLIAQFHNIQSAIRSKGVNFYNSPCQMNQEHCLKIVMVWHQNIIYAVVLYRT